MEFLTEIIRKKGMRIQGKTIYREAVRGIIMQGSTLLMIHSAKIGDYKFPGGGVEAGETYEDALKREILEECGARVAHIGQTFGKVIEYDIPSEADFDVFKMISYYYLCQIEATMEKQNLDQYEQDLGFEVRWIKIEDAIQINQKLNKNKKTAELRWLERETFVLQQIQQKLMNNEQQTG